MNEIRGEADTPSALWWGRVTTSVQWWSRLQAEVTQPQVQSLIPPLTSCVTTGVFPHPYIITCKMGIVELF